MAMYNYLRPLWRNGPCAVHDAPEWIVATIERMLARGCAELGEATLRVERDHGVAVAWVHCVVALEVEPSGSSYRRARFAHAIAMDGDDAERLTPELAASLLHSVYGASLQAGIAAEERFFERLDHPAGASAARNLFASRADDAGAAGDYAPAPRAASAQTPRPQSSHELLRRPAPPTPAARALPGVTPSLSALLWHRSPNPVGPAREVPPTRMPAAASQPMASASISARRPEPAADPIAYSHKGAAPAAALRSTWPEPPRRRAAAPVSASGGRPPLLLALALCMLGAGVLTLLGFAFLRAAPPRPAHLPGGLAAAAPAHVAARPAPPPPSGLGASLARTHAPVSEREAGAVPGVASGPPAGAAPVPRPAPPPMR